MPPETPSGLELEFDPGSFRDRHSRVLVHEGRVLRLLSPEAERAWEILDDTRFCSQATLDGHLIPAHKIDIESLGGGIEGNWTACLEHPCVPFVSYPYEWCFAMMRDAALLQLELILDALREDVISSDATPYNIQWRGIRPVFIDIGSFVPYQAGQLWNGYRQFCQMFLFPLMLQAYKGLPFQPWMRGSLEGVSAEHMLSLCSYRDYLRRGVLSHVMLQAKLQNRYADHSRDVRSDLREAGFGKKLVKRNISNLIALVKGLNWAPKESEWSDYGTVNSYSEAAFTTKSEFVDAALSAGPRHLVWDIGCNEGRFSRIAARHADYVLALDADPVVVERLYLELKKEGGDSILPLYFNVADPSPGMGWRNLERKELPQRGKPDFILALAVIHHMVIGANLPLRDCLRWFADITGEMVIEFVDRSDPMVMQLLRNREDIFSDYTLDNFESLLDRYFEVIAVRPLMDGGRRLYHVRSKVLAGAVAK